MESEITRSPRATIVAALIGAFTGAAVLVAPNVLQQVHGPSIPESCIYRDARGRAVDIYRRPECVDAAEAISRCAASAIESRECRAVARQLNRVRP